MPDPRRRFILRAFALAAGARDALRDVLRGVLRDALHDAPCVAPRNRGRAAIAPLLLVFCTFFLVLGACRKAPTEPEAQVLAVIEAIVDAAESSDARRLASHLDEDFMDHLGNDARSVMLVARPYLRSAGDARITTRVGEIAFPDPSRATVRVVAGLSDGPILAAGTRADVIRFDLTFVNRADTWRVERARWERGTLGDLAF